MLKFLGIMVALYKIIVLNLESYILKTAKMVAIFAESEISTFFCSFLCITSEIIELESWSCAQIEDLFMQIINLM